MIFEDKTLGTRFTLHAGDCLEILKTLGDNSVDCCVTSPPYWGLRDYGVEGQLGLEKTPEEYVAKMVGVFREVRRVLRDDGTLWLNLGDSYSGSGKGGNPPDSKWKGFVGNSKREKSAIGLQGVVPSGLKPKDLVGIPWRVAFALQADGWYLRQDIIWHKPNPMPESVRDRCTKAHEYVFLLSKSPKYYFDHEAIKEPAKYGPDPKFRNGKAYTDHQSFDNSGRKLRKSEPSGSFNGKTGNLAFRAILPVRNRRTVWTVSTKPFKGAHFATFPPDLIEPCVLAGCPKDGVVLDPFFGAGTTALVALKHGRQCIGIELNPEYCTLSTKRIEQAALTIAKARQK